MVIVRLRVSGLHGPYIVNDLGRESRVQLVQGRFEGSDGLKLVSFSEKGESVGTVSHVKKHFVEGVFSFVLVEG